MATRTPIRFITIPPHRIYNHLTPENSTLWDYFPEMHDVWWEDDVVEWRQKVGKIYRSEWDKATLHYTHLKISIKKYGVQNPIQAITGPLRRGTMDLLPESATPPKMRGKMDTVISSFRFGGSRLEIALELSFPVIPVIVYDYMNLYPKAETMKTIEQFASKFHDSYRVDIHRLTAKPRRFSHIVVDRYQQPGREVVGLRQEIFQKIREKVGLPERITK